MMERSWLLRSLLVYLLCAFGTADEIDVEVESGLMMRMLRDMANQTAADSLNLPANATSIRENITDTFSCENRTYGYYADVDNDCQIFHVCLTTESASGRNVTYRWSFICPAETVFNQVVLVCTRPRESIDCKDSPDYYDINKEIGKKDNKRADEDVEDIITNTIESPMNDKEVPNKKVEQVFPSRNPMKRKPVKQNYIIQQLIKDIVEEEMKDKIQDIDQEEIDIFPIISDNETKDIENRDRIVIPDKIIAAPAVLGNNDPKIIENRDRIVLPDEMVYVRTDYNDKREKETEDFERDDRLILERSMRRNLRGRNARGGIKFFRNVIV